MNIEVRTGETRVIPARTAHGAMYWTFIGWWWGPSKWIGRVALWLFLLPVGIWRSVHNSKRKTELRERRGAVKAAR